MLLPRATTSPLTNAVGSIMGGIDRRKKEEQAAQLKQLMGGALSGDANAMQQLATTDPNAFMAIQQHQGQQAAAQAKLTQQPVADTKMIKQRADANAMKQELLANVSVLPEDQREQALIDASSQFNSVYGGVLEFPTSIGEREARLFGQLNEKTTEIATKLAKDAALGRTDKYAAKFNSMYQPLAKVRGNVKNVEGLINNAIKNNSGVSDQAAIIALFKTLDPTSVVSQNESGTIVTSDSLPNQMVTAVNKLLSGEKMSNSLRNDILQTANVLIDQKENSFYHGMQPFVEASEREGLTIDDYMGGTLAQGYRDWMQTDTTKPVAVEVTKEDELLSEGEMIIKKHSEEKSTDFVIGEYTEDDIQDAVSRYGITREEVLQRLGGQ